VDLPRRHIAAHSTPAEVICPTSGTKTFLPKTPHLFCSARRHLPTACEVCSEQRRCLQPHTLGSGVSFTQARSARIASRLVRRGINSGYRLARRAESKTDVPVIMAHPALVQPVPRQDQGQLRVHLSGTCRIFINGSKVLALSGVSRWFNQSLFENLAFAVRTLRRLFQNVIRHARI
jgi:hypothetical protein